MANYVRVEEIIDMSPNSTMRHISNTNGAGQLSGLLMTHSSTVTQPVTSTNTSGFNLSPRVAEHSRMFPTSISSTTEQQPGISLSSLLNIQRIQRIQNPLNTITRPSDNFVINVEDHPTHNANSRDALSHANYHYDQSTTTDNFLNYIREGAHEIVNETQNIINHNSNNNNTNNNSGNDSNNNNNNRRNNSDNDGNNNSNSTENSADAIQNSPETRALLEVFQKYTPFVAILFAKGLYDHRAGVLNFIVLLVMFNHANNVVKREIAKQNNKSWISLFVITCYILACIVFINFEYDTHLFSWYTEPLTLWELLWSVLITDFILKLITIVCKVFLTCLPSKLLTVRKRGKYYLMVEATSQLYRCVVPVQPWFLYFFEAYQGPEKILGVAFSILYTVSKGNDLLARVKLFHTAIWKLIQNVNLGVSPSKEQLVASGGICAICHEEYSMPVRLHCKHIFCEACVLTWLDRERSCPLCRAAITDDPVYRDGHTTHFIQLY